MADDRKRQNSSKRWFGTLRLKSRKAAPATGTSDASIPPVLATTDSTTAGGTDIALRGASTKQSGLTLPGGLSNVSDLPDSAENATIARPSSNIDTDPTIPRDPAMRSSQSNSASTADTTSPPSTRSKYGLHRMKPTSCEKKGSLDIIAIHGINGDPFKTWTCEATGRLWLQDFLPDDVPGARVFSFGYDAQVCFSKSISGINEFAIMLLNSLLVNRRSEDCQSRPLIFICHSMGGIIAKQALVTAQLDQTEYGHIQQSLKAIFFLGTPHQGSDGVEWPILLDNVARVSFNLGASIWGKIRRDLLKSLKRNSEDLYALSVNFRNQIDGIRLVSFYEQQVTSPLRTVVVDKKSSTLAIPGEKLVPMDGCDHHTLCRFGDNNDFNYKLVLHEILPFTGVPDASLEVTVISLETPVVSSKVEEEELTEIQKKCLASLSFHGLEDREKDIQDPVDDTCGWLTKHDKFQKWLRQGHGLLLLKGKPGAGKSTLLKYALRQMGTAPLARDSRKVLTLSFFFNGRGSELHKSPLGLFRSILFQLARNVPIARNTVTQRFKEKIIVGRPGEAWDWHPKELCEITTNVLPQILKEYSIRLFVDALDECVRTNEADEDQLEDFWTLFSDACAVCISHREFPLVNLNSELEVHVDEENRPDIETYVRKKLGTDQDELRELIIESSHGIFMWTGLVVAKVSQRLREKEDRKTIMSEIRRFPQGLGKLYKQLLEAVPEEDKHKTLKLMRWICFSMEPLTLDGMRFAMVVDANTKVQTMEQYRAMSDFTDSNETMESRVKRYSRGLAEIIERRERKTIQFIHQSVSDFFAEIGLQIMDPDCASKNSAIGRAHLFLSRSCINFIATEGPQDLDELDELKKFSRYGRYFKQNQAGSSLALYATKYWTLHAQNAEIKNIQADILGPLGWPSQEVFEKWKRMSQIIDEYSHVCPKEETTILHTLSIYGLITPVSIILQGTNQAISDINIQDAKGRTSLSWAAAEGHVAMIELLIRQGADPNHGTRTPLSEAAETGDTTIVKFLLDHGADIDLPSGERQQLSPLSHAVNRWQTAVVKLLLLRGADPNYVDRGTLLLGAAKKGDRAMMALSLEKGANPNHFYGTDQTPLSWAAEERHTAIVQLLLNKGADPNHQDGTKRSPLSRAAAKGHTAVVEFLLNKGANPNYHDEINQTPLLWAAKKGHAAVVKLLIDKAESLNHRDKYGRTLFWWAVANEDATLVEWLLADARINPNEGQAPLVEAARFGNQTVFKLLVENDRVNPNAAGAEDQTSLHFAAARGHEGMVTLLLANDRVEPDLRDAYGRTPFSRAASKGNIAILELLLATGRINPDSRDQDNIPPLFWALMEGGHHAFEWLLSFNGIVLDCSDWKDRLVSISMVRGIHRRGFLQDAVINVLLENYIRKPNREEKARIRYEIAIKLFLEKDNSALDLEYFIGQEPSSYELKEQDLARLRLFIRMPNSGMYEFEDDYGRRLISFAIEYGHIKVVQLLIGKDNRWLNSRDSGNRSPMYWGARKGQKPIRDFLRSRGAKI